MDNKEGRGRETCPSGVTSGAEVDRPPRTPRARSCPDRVHQQGPRGSRWNRVSESVTKEEMCSHDCKAARHPKEKIN